MTHNNLVKHALILSLCPFRDEEQLVSYHTAYRCVGESQYLNSDLSNSKARLALGTLGRSLPDTKESRKEILGLTHDPSPSTAQLESGIRVSCCYVQPFPNISTIAALGAKLREHTSRFHKQIEQKQSFIDISQTSNTFSILFHSCLI
jgi:hypothetical protein